jgi:hypothetical protein
MEAVPKPKSKKGILGRLLDEIAKKQKESYDYDPVGNRVRIPAPRTIRYVYDNEDVILKYLKHGDREERTASYLHGPGIDEPLVVEKRRSPL